MVDGAEAFSVPVSAIVGRELPPTNEAEPIYEAESSIGLVVEVSETSQSGPAETTR